MRGRGSESPNLDSDGPYMDSSGDEAWNDKDKRSPAELARELLGVDPKKSWEAREAQRKW